MKSGVVVAVVPFGPSWTRSPTSTGEQDRCAPRPAVHAQPPFPGAGSEGHRRREAARSDSTVATHRGSTQRLDDDPRSIRVVHVKLEGCAHAHGAPLKRRSLRRGAHRRDEVWAAPATEKDIGELQGPGSVELACTHHVPAPGAKVVAGVKVHVPPPKHAVPAATTWLILGEAAESLTQTRYDVAPETAVHE